MTFKFDDPLATASALVIDLPGRVMDTFKKGEVKGIAELYSDLAFLQAAIEQLATEAKEKADGNQR